MRFGAIGTLCANRWTKHVRRQIDNSMRASERASKRAKLIESREAKRGQEDDDRAVEIERAMHAACH